MPSPRSNKETQGNSLKFLHRYPWVSILTEPWPFLLPQHPLPTHSILACSLCFSQASPRQGLMEPELVSNSLCINLGFVTILPLSLSPGIRDMPEVWFMWCWGPNHMAMYLHARQTPIPTELHPQPYFSSILPNQVTFLLIP